MMQFLQSMQESGEKCKMEKLLAYGSPAAMEGAETGKKRHRHRPINRFDQGWSKIYYKQSKLKLQVPTKNHSDLPDPLLQLGSLVKPSKPQLLLTIRIFSLLSCNMDHITVKYNQAAN
ncbi:hypothetical protein MJO29_006729 [Puccinia striiformis f. sp. tritici]|nr:hypothetical protein MJO29_006729 [Puccinia striiformis f. sp. tritici]